MSRIIKLLEDRLKEPDGFFVDFDLTDGTTIEDVAILAVTEHPRGVSVLIPYERIAAARINE